MVERSEHPSKDSMYIFTISTTLLLRSLRVPTTTTFSVTTGIAFASYRVTVWDSKAKPITSVYRDSIWCFWWCLQSYLGIISARPVAMATHKPGPRLSLVKCYIVGCKRMLTFTQQMTVSHLEIGDNLCYLYPTHISDDRQPDVRTLPDWCPRPAESCRVDIDEDTTAGAWTELF